MIDRKKNQKLQPASSVLQSVLSKGQNALSDQFLRWRLWNSWGDIVGAKIAAYSIPVGYRDGALIIWVKTSAHLQELKFGIEPLKEKANQFVGFSWVKEIKLTIDRKSVPMPEETSNQLREFLADSEK